MTFDAIYNSAVDVVNKFAAGGERLGPDRTVCVICSGTGRIYYGISKGEIHAEIDAMQYLQQFGDPVAAQLILINTADMTALLPCNGCMGYILSQNPENQRCLIAMPDRMIPITEIAAFPGPGGGNAPVSAPAKNISAKSDMLKNRVSSLMEGLDDDSDDDDEELLKELEKPKKKKFFGLFG